MDMEDTLYGANYASEDEDYSDEQNAELLALLAEAEEDYWESQESDDVNEGDDDFYDHYDEESSP